MDTVSIIKEHSCGQTSVFLNGILNSDIFIHCSSPDVSMFEYVACKKEWISHDARGCLFFVSDDNAVSRLVLIGRSPTAYYSVFILPLAKGLERVQWHNRERKNLLIQTIDHAEVYNLHFTASADRDKFSLLLSEHL